MKTAEFPFDNYVLFSNGKIAEVMYMDIKKLKQEGKSYYYEYVDYETPDSVHLVKKRTRAIYMSDSYKELTEYIKSKT